MPFVPITQLSPIKVQWLWPGRLPIGYLSIMDGDPGLGKSLVTVDLCARITTGRPFPDGTGSGIGGGKPAGVILINAEDRARDTIYARLRAAGANLDLVHVWERAASESFLRLPNHVGRLEEALARTGARYVAIDPIMAFLDSSVNVASDPHVRQALLPLAELADRRRCAINMVRHLSKTSRRSALYRGLFSIGFVASCRVAWLVGRDPHNLRKCVLAQHKSNLDPPQPSLAYQIKSDPSGEAVIEWQGTSFSNEDDLARGVLSRRKQLQMRSEDFLETMLKDGPRTSREIWEAAQKQHISARQIRNAQKRLKMRDVRVGAIGPNQVTYWLREDQELPAGGEDTETARYMDNFFRKHEKLYAERNPLDELPTK
ncbi:MAG: AAA family ATPase [Planctomycetes bacterium]|nr:AAA family ATPase [Planctomycetota bacterium]